MKNNILLLADPASAHTIKWANSLNNNGYQITVVGFSADFDKSQYNIGIQVYNLFVNSELKSKRDGAFSKLLYLKNTLKIKKIINDIKPNLIHVHYATSYGLLALLIGYRPYIISVWGSDINEFPKRNFIYKNLLKLILNNANGLCATSQDLAVNTSLYSNKKINIIPFGVDTNIFKPSLKTSEKKYIGAIKTLEANYGIENVIRAFALVKGKISNFNYKLLIVGTGSQTTYLKNLVSELKIAEVTTFTGFVEYNKIHEYHQLLKIGVYPSIQESFGVAIAETMACGGVVIASKVGGIKEIVEDTITGYLVEPCNSEKIADKIIELLSDEEKLNRFSDNSINRIKELYSIEYMIKKINEVYKSVMYGSNDD